MWMIDESVCVPVAVGNGSSRDVAPMLTRIHTQINVGQVVVDE